MVRVFVKFDHADFILLLLEDEEKTEINSLLKLLLYFYSVTNELQSDVINLADDKILFDGILENYVLLHNSLYPRATIS